MVGLLCACQIAINPIKSKSAGSIINKVGDYAAAGLPVINSQENEEYRRLIKEKESIQEIAKATNLKEKEKKLETIKDCIKRITGDTYGIYDELFFKTVRISIRHVLEKSITQKMSLFGNEENKAEDSIYEYIEKNYENPYQDWQSSSNNSYVETLGFKVFSIEEIIKDWAYYNKISSQPSL